MSKEAKEKNKAKMLWFGKGNKIKMLPPKPARATIWLGRFPGELYKDGQTPEEAAKE